MSRNLIKNLLLGLIFVAALWVRIPLMFGPEGGDYQTYLEAMGTFFEGESLYKETVDSFTDASEIYVEGDHGYAYLPGILYVNIFFYFISLLTKIPLIIALRIPVLLADIAIGLLLVKIFSRKNYFYLVLALLFWFFHPNFVLEQNSGRYDPLPIFFMLLALYYLGEDDVNSAVSYAFAILLKTFPIILFPIFIYKARSKLKFIGVGAFIALLSSLPFMKSLEDFRYYIQGAVLVHGDRKIQGRPFLYFISYYLHIVILRYVPIMLYSRVALLGAMAVSAWGVLRTNLDKYVLSTLAFIFFYIFTPVLNSTYLLWFLPVYAVAAFSLSQKSKYPKVFYTLCLVGLWLFYFWYLSIWDEGFHNWRPEGVYFDH